MYAAATLSAGGGWGTYDSHGASWGQSRPIELGGDPVLFFDYVSKQAGDLRDVGLVGLVSPLVGWGGFGFSGPLTTGLPSHVAGNDHDHVTEQCEFLLLPLFSIRDWPTAGE